MSFVWTILLVLCFPCKNPRTYLGNSPGHLDRPAQIHPISVLYTRIELPVRATPNQEMRSKFFLCQKRQISGRTDYLIVVDRKKRAKFRLRDNKFKKLFLSFVLSLPLFFLSLFFNKAILGRYEIFREK